MMSEEIVKIQEVWVRIPDSKKPHRAIKGLRTFCGKDAKDVEVLGGGFKSDEVCQDCLSKMKARNSLLPE